jgi:hypothetical protein
MRVISSKSFVYILQNPIQTINIRLVGNKSVSLYPKICAIVPHQWGTIKQMTQLRFFISSKVYSKLISASMCQNVNKILYYMYKIVSAKYIEHVWSFM